MTTYVMTGPIKPIGYILRHVSGATLCTDNRYRSFMPIESIKVYKTLGRAARKVRTITPSDWTLIPVYAGDSIDACGRVYPGIVDNAEWEALDRRK